MLPLVRALLFPILLALLSCQSGTEAPATLPNTSFQLDRSFNQTGVVTTTLSNGSDTVQAVAIQADGKIVVAGSTWNSKTKTDIALLRYNNDGSLDNTFNAFGATPGVVITDVGGGADLAYAVAIQPLDGKIVLAGSSYNSATSKTETLVARYNTDGSLDAGFNATGAIPGIITTAVTTGNNYAKCMALQSDGRIVVAGQAHNGTDHDIAVVRYNSDGSLDTGFNATGVVTAEVMTLYSASTARDDIANALRIQTDGMIVMAGNSGDSGLVMRLNSNGARDSTFGDGSSGIKLLTGMNQANDLAIQPVDQALVISGTRGGSHTDMAVVRLDTIGMFDAGFGTGGLVKFGFLGGRNDSATSIALQTDGKLVVAGGASSDIGYDFAVARLLADGSLDAAFGQNGKASTAIGAGSDAITAIALQSDGRIVAAGASWANTRWIIALARYLP